MGNVYVHARHGVPDYYFNPVQQEFLSFQLGNIKFKCFQTNLKPQTSDPKI